jgi:cytochrome c-type biogenesis protein CcmH/NrfF
MRAFLVVALVVVAAFAAGFGASRLLAPAAPADRQLAVEQRLMCPQCTETRLDACDRPICADMKADIAARLRAGESPDAIVASYEEAYGPAVVAQQPGPPLASSVPLLMLAAVLGLVALVIGRRPPARSPA